MTTLGNFLGQYEENLTKSFLDFGREPSRVLLIIPPISIFSEGKCKLFGHKSKANKIILRGINFNVISYPKLNISHVENT